MRRLLSRCLTLGAAAIVACAGCNLERSKAMRALDSKDPAVRAKALSALANARARSALPRAAKLLRDRSARVRRAAVAAVGALGPGVHLSAIIDRLHDDDLQVRLGAARVLGHSKRSSAKRALLPALRDPSMVVRRATTAALGQLGLSRAAQVAALAEHELAEQLRMLRDSRPGVRAQAARTLGAMQHQLARAALSRALGDKDPTVVRAAARALAPVADAKARAALRALAKLPDRVLRRAAAAGLAALASPTPADRDALAKLLDPTMPAVAHAAVAGLAARACTRPRGDAATAKALCAVATESEDRALAGAAARLCGRCALDCVVGRGKLRQAMAARDADGAPSKGALAAARLLAWLGDGADVGRVASALRGWHTLLQAQSKRWIDSAAWRALDGGAGATPTSRPHNDNKPTPGKSPDKRASKRKKLDWLLARFPERKPDGTQRDPLLPARIDVAALEGVVVALSGRRESNAMLVELASQSGARAPLRLVALRALARQPAGSASKLADVFARSLAANAPRALRRAAIDACNAVGPRATRLARTLLADKDFEVRAGAARCLGDARAKDAVKDLISALARERQAAVIEALAAIGDRRAADALLALLREDHPLARRDERLLVVEALGRLGEPKAAQTLRRELFHPDPVLRAAAARALAALGASGPAAHGARIRAALAACSKDSHAAVREACSDALAKAKKLTP